MSNVAGLMFSVSKRTFFQNGLVNLCQLPGTKFSGLRPTHTHIWPAIHHASSAMPELF